VVDIVLFWGIIFGVVGWEHCGGSLDALGTGCRRGPWGGTPRLYKLNVR
jgi:hypothetical protein